VRGTAARSLRLLYRLLLRPAWIPERSATRLREADLNFLSKLGNQGLEWRLEPEAFNITLMIMGDLKIRCVAVGSWRRPHDDIGRRRVITAVRSGLGCNTDILHCRRICPKPIGDDAARSPVFLHDPLEKLQRRSLVPPRCDHSLQRCGLFV
jgi:hypothetical protein